MTAPYRESAAPLVIPESRWTRICRWWNGLFYRSHDQLQPPGDDLWTLLDAAAEAPSLPEVPTIAAWSGLTPQCSKCKGFLHSVWGAEFQRDTGLMRRKCSNCNYVWMERPADAQ